MSAPVLRIFSDLHYRDGQSSLQRLDAMAPLLEGADQIVLNGDTLDTQTASALPDLAEARAFFAQHTPGSIFLSGNHDPDISDQTELSLRDDRIWITHGDVLFDEIAPWSSLRPEMVRRLTGLVNAPPEGADRVRARLHRHRLACLNLPTHHDRLNRSLIYRSVRLANTLFPPHRLLAMLDAWRTTPSLARSLALAERPRSRLVVVGHTHYPGVWRDREGPVVINTGSFCRPFGGLFVEVCGENVRAVRIVRKGGEFHPGRVIAEFSVADR